MANRRGLGRGARWCDRAGRGRVVRRRTHECDRLHERARSQGGRPPRRRAPPGRRARLRADPRGLGNRDRRGSHVRGVRRRPPGEGAGARPRRREERGQLPHRGRPGVGERSRRAVAGPHDEHRRGCPQRRRQVARRSRHLGRAAGGFRDPRGRSGNPLQPVQRDHRGGHREGRGHRFDRGVDRAARRPRRGGRGRHPARPRGLLHRDRDGRDRRWPGSSSTSRSSCRT